jgi:purine-cytosine permease-like protein
MCVISFVLAIYGHATLVASFRFIAISSAAVSILAVIVLSDKFTAVDGGKYLLGDYWPTWVLTMVLAASLPISWGPFIGDYGRYIPSNVSAKTNALAAGFGIFAGCWISELIGAYAQTTFKDPLAPFATGFPDTAPLWLAILLMLAPGGLANIESAAMSVYNCALDVHAVFYKITRAQLTAAMSVVGFVGAYIALIDLDAILSIEAFVTIMLITCTPWMVIMTVGHLMRGGRYVPQDLHAFASPSHRGVYWFTGGINYRAFAAWVAATGVGLLFASTSIITGPLTDHVSGIDLSFMSSAIVGGVVYYVLVKVFPEHGVDPNPAAPDLGVPPGVVGA